MKTLRFILFVLFFTLVLSGCGPPGVAGQLMQLPDEGRLLVLSIVTAGVTWLLLKASEVFKIDLKGYSNLVAAALAPIIVTLIEAGLQTIPPIFDNLVLSIIHLIVLLVGSLGTFFLFRRQAPSLR
jgi:hypothetical protein